MVDKKKAAVAIVGIAIVVALAASFSSYIGQVDQQTQGTQNCLLYTSPSPRDGLLSRMPSSA